MTTTRYPLASFLRLLAIGLLACMTPSLQATPPSSTADDLSCPVEHITFQRLPDMQVARANHAFFCLDGELTAIGGHTDGFVPTQTAEYYADGEWHLMDMPYTADFSLAQRLSSGLVLLAGGMSENLGVGQLWTVQSYDPRHHRFTGFGCLDRKRSMASGVELDSGRVVISGNWYAGDSIELFDGKSASAHVKPVAQTRAYPYIFRTARDNAIIFGSFGPRAEHYDTIWVDRFRGESFRPALFDTWKPLSYLIGDRRTQDCFIGDEVRGDYAYLLPLMRADSAVAIGLLRGEEFSLLPTDVPVPREGVGERIDFQDHLVVDRKAQRAYLMSLANSGRLYLLRIDYSPLGGGRPARLTLLYTDPLPELVNVYPVVMPDGNLAVAGGNMLLEGRHLVNNNYSPTRAAYILHVSPEAAAAGGNFSWWWVLVLVAALVALAGFLRWRKRGVNGADGANGVNGSHGVNGMDGASGAAPSGTEVPLGTEVPSGTEAATGTEVPSGSQETALMQRITALMEEERLFLRSDLKINDVAELLGVSRTTISNCIRAERDTTFPNFVNAYRVDYVKQLMLQHPEAKISSLYLEAGFANETSFFRTFKEITGTTPSEWREANLQNK